MVKKLLCPSAMEAPTTALPTYLTDQYGALTSFGKLAGVGRRVRNRWVCYKRGPVGTFRGGPNLHWAG